MARNDCLPPWGRQFFCASAPSLSGPEALAAVPRPSGFAPRFRFLPEPGFLCCHPAGRGYFPPAAGWVVGTKSCLSSLRSEEPFSVLCLNETNVGARSEGSRSRPGQSGINRSIPRFLFRFPWPWFAPPSVCLAQHLSLIKHNTDENFSFFRTGFRLEARASPIPPTTAHAAGLDGIPSP